MFQHDLNRVASFVTMADALLVGDAMDARREHAETFDQILVLDYLERCVCGDAYSALSDAQTRCLVSLLFCRSTHLDGDGTQTHNLRIRRILFLSILKEIRCTPSSPHFDWLAKDALNSESNVSLQRFVDSVMAENVEKVDEC
jgi:hypothetical protein